jgi:hypothetical protein
LSGLASAKSGATIRLTKEAREADAKKVKEALKDAQPRATFSLFGFGGQTEEPEPASPAKKVAAGSVKKSVRSAPRGVPTILNWRKNRDGSITGKITGSASFSEGEKVTTSPIATGKIDGGEIVKTGSGSRYFLS